MSALLGTVVVASLVGSLHCAGMCGGLVVFYSGADASQGLRRMFAHVAYSLGRLFTYALFGAAAGAIGAALDLAGSLAGVQRTAALVAGVAMVVWGVVALLQLRGFRLFKHSASPRLQVLLRRGFAIAGDTPPLARALVVGLLTGLMPCGWLWAFLVVAAGTGGALQGAAVMAAFWVGTVPVLVAVGVGAQVLATPLRRHVPSLTAVLLVVLGVLAIVVRPASIAAAVARQEQQTEHKVSDIDHEALPCCGEGEE